MRTAIKNYRLVELREGEWLLEVGRNDKFRIFLIGENEYEVVDLSTYKKSTYTSIHKAIEALSTVKLNPLPLDIQDKL